MKIKNTHLKKGIALFVIILTTVCQISPQTAYAWDDDTDTPFNETTIVRFGLIDKNTGEMVQSEPDYFFDHYKYGIAHSVYNAVYHQWGDNADMCPDVSILWDDIYELLGADFFSLLSSQRYLMNIVFNVDTGKVVVCLNRTPGVSDYPFYNIEAIDEYNFKMEVGPQGYKGGAWVFTTNGYNSSFGMYKSVATFAPYINRNIGEIIRPAPTYGDNYSAVYTSYNSASSFDDLVNHLDEGNCRCALFTFTISVPQCRVSMNSLADHMYLYYTNAVSPQGFAYNFPIANNASNFKVVMSDFPFYENYTNNYSPVQANVCPANGNTKTNVRFNTSWIYQNLQNDVPPFKISSSTPILITGYDEIPSITPTPTPTGPVVTPAWPTASPTPAPTALPTMTLAPSPTPSGVSPIEGVESMFTLFTRKYEINVMGVDVGIRPFFLFLGCFIVGSIITMIQGGNKS